MHGAALGFVLQNGQQKPVAALQGAGALGRCWLLLTFPVSHQSVGADWNHAPSVESQLLLSKCSLVHTQSVVPACSAVGAAPGVLLLREVSAPSWLCCEGSTAPSCGVTQCARQHRVSLFKSLISILMKKLLIRNNEGQPNK